MDYNAYWGNLWKYLKYQVNKNKNNISDSQILWNIILEKELDGININYTPVIQELLNNNDGEIIIDMGSGWGRYAISLINNGVSQNIYALEYAHTGRNITNYFGNILKNQVKSYEFNYNNPNFTMIEENKDVFVYSIHSIEQIQNISENLFIKLINRFNKVKGFHLEPVGWQIVETEINEKDIYERKRCKKASYNENLWSILKKLEVKQKIKILKVKKYFHRHGTLIIWEKILY